MKKGLSVIALSLLFGVCAAQEPTTQVTNVPHLSLVPLVILNIGSGEISAPVFSPTGAVRPPAEFFLPRNGSKEITVTTSGGNVKVIFANSVPAGVPASAFQWEQTSVPAGNAVGRLRYNGCSSCPASFTLDVTASSNETVHATVKLNLTASTGRPIMNSITPNGGDKVRFTPTTFDSSDSQVVGTYASGLRYRLLTESNSQFADGRMNVIIPRLEVDRNVRVALVNPYGSSGSTNVTLPQEGNIENPVFEQINASGGFPNSAQVGDTFSVKHTNNGVLAVSGTDEIPIQPLASSTACNQRDYIFQSARASWMGNLVQFDAPGGTKILPDQPVTTLGRISITSQPPANALLRSPNNKIRVSWTLDARGGDEFYQVVYRGVEVVGVCSDHIIH